ncbi:MAG: hydantoinase/oxoprolinase family protein [Anaerolineae bacterium]|nr:hydantoinase/oxoprolinase family protein [Anaerolineae bacterium]
MAIALGIDTGGTYTDAVLVEYGTNKVLLSAKALTTKRDLTIGIRAAVQQIVGHADGISAAEVSLVSLSTTLATNAIVEGNGAPICALLIGYAGRLDPGINVCEALGTERVVLIPGGHRTTGEEWEPLDLEAARAAIALHAPAVAGFAVSGYFGTRNPEHELAVRDLVCQMTGLPVTCGHDLTHRLDALRRATTVALNARLIPLLCDLIDSVERIMEEQGIHAPLMVVKGDGSLMDAAVARERPIETILSGPAASVVGAQHLAKGEDMVVVDMGGTTTDIAVIDGQGPQLSLQGARVGQWRTMVEAIDVHTAGLGGDSHVWLDEVEALHIGPRRVVPLSLLATEYPEVREQLAAQLSATKPNRGALGEFLMLQNAHWATEGARPPFEGELLGRLTQGPCTLDQVRQIVRYPELYGRYLNQLERQGVLVRSALTPSDAAHALGLYAAWDVEAARLGAELLARRLSRASEDLCHYILRQTSVHIAREVVAKLLSDDRLNGHHADAIDSELLARALCPAEGSALGCHLTLRPTLVAIGAPVHTYFPLVAELLHGKLIIPEHTEVANAIGAVAGSVVQRVRAIIVPHEEEGYRIHLPNEVALRASLPEAVNYATAKAEILAREGALRAGAEDVRVRSSRHDRTAPVADGWGERIFVQTDLEVTAVGRPRLAH